MIDRESHRSIFDYSLPHSVMAARLQASLVQNGECLEWTKGTVNGGYGQMWVGLHVRTGKRAQLRTHRIAWELKNGRIPYALDVLHSCDNPKCCNVDHLRLGTARENSGDAIKRSRQAKGNKFPQAKLTPRLVRVIRASAGLKPQTALACELGVHQSLISKVLNNHIWNHVQ